MNTEDFFDRFNKDFNYDGINLIFKFFITFSRFEYALKSAGFCDGNENSIKPSWDKFANSIRLKFDYFIDENLTNAVEYLISNPPKKQVLDSGILVFKNRSNLDELNIVHRLKLNICDIRNNLFHGGKFDGDFEPEISRNYLLLKNALTVLDNWLLLEEDVKHYFFLPVPY
jgi:hypothetical protein